MTRQWTSAVAAPCPILRRLLLPLLMWALSACSDVQESSPPVIASDGASEDQVDLSGPADASSNLLTGAPIGSRFQVWICADLAGTNLGYTFAAVIGDSTDSGVGHEVLLSESLSRAFRWTMSDENRLSIQFTDDESVLEWQMLGFDLPGRLTLVSTERGQMSCMLQSVEMQSTTAQQPAQSQPELSSEDRLLAVLPGRHSGNGANGLSAGDAADLSLWVCESEEGLLAQTYFVPESDRVQGQYIEATGINAVRSGRWMTTATDAVRLDLALQGEIIMSEVVLDQQTRFSATSNRDGSLSCVLESMTLSTPQDRS